MKIVEARKVFVPEIGGRGIINGDISYTSRSGLELIHSYGVIQGSDRYDEYRERFSSDNGATWTEPRLQLAMEEVEGGTVRRYITAYFLDEEKDTLLRFLNVGFYPRDDPSLALWEVYYQLFEREGRAWSEPIRVESDEATEDQPFPGVPRGSLAISCSLPIKIEGGKIVVPCQLKAFKDGKVWFPFKHYFSPFYESAFLIGRWRKGMLAWEMSEKITIDPNVCCRLCEPTVVELEGGSLLAIMRGDNGAFPERPGYKWASTSEDGGYSWTEPAPLKYDGGDPLLSPSSCSALFRSWKTGKIYWIANILDGNPVGNRPRYPLQIAEIDEDTLAVRRETITVVDDRLEGDSPMVQLSNFRFYQDRTSGDLVLLMARYGERGSGRDLILRSPLYRYRIRLE